MTRSLRRLVALLLAVWLPLASSALAAASMPGRDCCGRGQAHDTSLATVAAKPCADLFAAAQHDVPAMPGDCEATALPADAGHGGCACLGQCGATSLVSLTNVVALPAAPPGAFVDPGSPPARLAVVDPDPIDRPPIA